MAATEGTAPILTSDSPLVPAPAPGLAEKLQEAEAATKPPSDDLVEQEKKPEAAPAVNLPSSEATVTDQKPEEIKKEEIRSLGPTWPELSSDHPLSKFYSQITDITTSASHDEVYGIKLSPSNEFQTKLILQKFLRANADEVEKAKQQLLDTLKWRKEFNPIAAMDEKFSKERFTGLGYIMKLDDVPESTNKSDIVTFNIYGAVKDNKATFGDLEGFLRWRVGIMERSVHKLGLANATQPIPDFGKGPDPYQGFQVHDYKNVSFLRMDPHTKAASKKTIEILGKYYPETLSRKFFVNVPVIMGWVFAAMKFVVAKETVKKFTVLSYGEQLATELGSGVPKEYGGSAGELGDIGEGMKMSD
ncbi:CRAL/TRIO domain-containing protein [Delitschia confertaspora ATCC 74209]|uniref:Phosphatidylinositol transfer protein SFH5 n=1 Tax=Delitschia confertaspora ATCC 74209 TaxID=1513339 RepID=A0A9P4JQP3_9PLEO|nr:CRAL/TRIO domain-containing protein [Delitschia confertaspora ATCC 74209]